LDLLTHMLVVMNMGALRRRSTTKTVRD
jgi:hypothetical protein